MKKIKNYFIGFMTFVLILASCNQVSNTDNSTPPVYNGSYLIKDLNGETIFSSTKYVSDIDLTDETLGLSHLNNQIGWEDENGQVYKLNSKIENCTGDKIFKPSCYKNNADSVGDIRLADNTYVTAEQMTGLKNQLAEPISVVISYPEDSSFWKLEMALEFIECKDFWTEDSEAAKLCDYKKQKGSSFGEYTFTQEFPQVIYNLYYNIEDGSFEKDGSVIYDVWCQTFSDGNTDKYPAFYFTHNCTKGGFTDWYLPSQYEIDGRNWGNDIYDFYSLTPAISKSLRACGFDNLFRVKRTPDFPLFQFFRASMGKLLNDVWHCTGVKKDFEYACAVRKF